MRRGVIFDLGNVLVDVDHGAALRKLKRHSPLPLDRLRIALSGSPLLERFESGEIDARSFYAGVCGEVGVRLDFEAFCAIYCDMFSPRSDIVEVNSALHARGIATYIFSNTSALHFDHISRHYAFMSEFTDYFLSYRLGAMKPRAASYEAVEKATGLSGDALIYIDDRIENVEAGTGRGWQAIRHTSPAETLRKLRELELLT